MKVTGICGDAGKPAAGVSARLPLSQNPSAGRMGAPQLGHAGPTTVDAAQLEAAGGAGGAGGGDQLGADGAGGGGGDQLGADGAEGGGDQLGADGAGGGV